MQTGSSIRNVVNSGQDRATWLVLLFLLAGVVAPAGAVLWFVNRAAQSEAEAARREIADAYAGQLRLLRDRVEQSWNERAAGLTAAGGLQQIVARGLAESAVLLNADGSLRYPRPNKPPAPDATAALFDWRAAQSMETAHDWNGAAERYVAIARYSAADADLYAKAVQAEIRCLVLAGHRDRAIARIGEEFYAGTGYAAVDGQGRRYAADALLLAASLAGPGDRRRAAALDRLSRLLNGADRADRADGDNIPAAQRLFAMSEAQALGAKPFPTYQAERLAAQFLEADYPRVAGAGLLPTNVPDVWKLGSPDGRIIALLRTASVIEATNRVLNNAAFTAVPPGAAVTHQWGESVVAAGPMLPGWQLAFSGVDTRRAETESARRRQTYLWTGYLVIASMALAGLLSGRSLRKQMQLARLKTDMVALVAHELKTPLASISVLVDSLLDDACPDPVKTREYLSLISGENERLTRLVENFLSFSRIERRRQKFQFCAAEPGRIVDTAVAAVGERFKRSSCTLKVDVEPGLPLVEADPDALATALVNLLENAYKYTPGEKRLAVRAYGDTGRVVFAVADNGIGIPAREHKRIFRKFYQVDQALSRASGGCGLGLSVVDHIVRAHGGKVVVASKPGEGSTFSVMVPALSSLSSLSGAKAAL